MVILLLLSLLPFPPHLLFLQDLLRFIFSFHSSSLSFSSWNSFPYLLPIIFSYFFLFILLAFHCLLTCVYLLFSSFLSFLLRFIAYSSASLFASLSAPSSFPSRSSSFLQPLHLFKLFFLFFLFLLFSSSSASSSLSPVFSSLSFLIHLASSCLLFFSSNYVFLASSHFLRVKRLQQGKTKSAQYNLLQSKLLVFSSACLYYLFNCTKILNFFKGFSSTIVLES